MVALASLYRSLEQEPQSGLILTSDRRIVRTNSAWERFARANGGEAVLARYTRGVCIDDAISPDLRAFYARAFDRALETGKPFEHVYDCDSTDTHRRFRMIVYPVEGQFLAVSNALEVTVPLQRSHEPARDADYIAHGIITMCSHCRRTRRAGTKQWDWVPAYVTHMPSNISHGLCETCFPFYTAGLEL
jgi:hypothetical protein